ncbi:NUDIX hydrolase [Paraburkholderia aspalathi]|nr:NUDIX hydrolase [Paraburkholderia aspalathi]MBK3779934.1 NUDIX hydrolase [Paraburkholderia aspalathi]
MNKEKTIYATGLMFNKAFTRAAFVEKNRPVFLAGRLCPTGGGVEFGETPRQAAAREHGEETLVLTLEEAWTPYARIEREDAVVHCFYAVSDEVEQCRTNTSEKNYEVVHVLDLKEVLTAAVTPAVHGQPKVFLLDERSVSHDLVALIGLALRARRMPGIALISG